MENSMRWTDSRSHGHGLGAASLAALNSVAAFATPLRSDDTRAWARARMIVSPDTMQG